MLYDEKQFLDLLLEYKSDETKKARRNASLIAFIVITACVLGIKITKIQVLGIDVSHTAELPVLALAAALLVYWMLMFAIAWMHDAEIQKERSIILQAQVEQFTKRYEQKIRDGAGGKGYFDPDFGPLKVAVETYRAQQERLSKATLFGITIKGMEVVVPTALSYIAILILTRWIYDAF